MFDPNLPQAGTEIDAVQMRDQLNGLKDLIDAVPAGPPGPQGPAGPAGPPGEISQLDLDDAINGTSNNSDVVELLAISFEDPPSLNDMETVGNKINELILTLRRN